MAKVYCDVNLRPRVDGVPLLLEKGEPFDEEMINPHTAKTLREQGLLHDEGEFEVIEEAEAVEVAEVVEEEPKAPAPEGIWNYKRSEIEDMDLDTLNALYKSVAAEHGLSVRAFRSKEKALDKLCSESSED